MDFASGKRFSFHFQIHFSINICSVERDVQAPEFTVANSGSTVTCCLAAATFSLGVRVPMAP
jgi:hypothetical protein